MRVLVIANNIFQKITSIDFVSMCMSMNWRCKKIRDWYETLQKPSWTPPSWVFSPVWTILYICIALAGWIIFNEKKVPLSLKIAFTVQVITNIIWSPLFFDMQNPKIALLDLFIMWSANLFCLYKTYDKMQTVFLLLLPYQLWMTYAASINLYVAMYN